MAQINNYFNYLKRYYENFPWEKGEIKVSEYRSKKTVEAVQYVDHHSSIEALKELAGNKIKVEDSKVSLYNSDFEVYIEINEGEWIVKDDEDLFVMTDSEFREAYESETEIENKITNEKLLDYITHLSREQVYPYTDTLTGTDKIYSPYGSSTYTLNNSYIANNTLSSSYNIADQVYSNDLSSSFNSLSDRLDKLESKFSMSETGKDEVTKDKMDKFIEDYVTPNGN